MRITIDIRLLASGRITGIEEYTRQIVRHILSRDRDNEYALFFNSFRLPAPDFGPDAHSVTRRFPNKAFDAAVRFFGVPRIDRMTPTDVVFSPHFNILARSKGVPRVMTIHDLSFVHYPEFFSLRKRFWHWLQNHQAQIREADHIIAVSDYTKADIVDQTGIPAERITRIYSGIDASLYPRDPKDPLVNRFRKERDLTRPFILSFAAQEPRKNISAIVKAFTILKTRPQYRDWLLVLAGSSGWLSGELARTIANSSAKADIRVLGAIKDDERPLLYNCASVFVYPSFFEGFGLPPLEAQACGVPVVASNRSSLPEILGSSALLVDPWRIDDIADAIHALAGSNELKKRMIAQGLENSRQFSWDNAADKTIQIFKSFPTLA
jgi:glycosyltransferase involved in cell wall biosynthesis